MKNIKHRLLYPFIIILILGMVGILSCSQVKQVPAPSSTPQNPAPPEYYPTILASAARIITEDGVLSSDVNHSISFPGFYSESDWAGETVFYLDVEPPLKAGSSALTAEGTYQNTVGNSALWKNLTPGKHTFSAQLVKHDMTPLDPPVNTSIQLDIPSPGTTAPVILSTSMNMLCRPGYTPPNMSDRPQNASTCADINVSVDVNNFTPFANKIGQSSIPGEGHFIYYFNVNPPMTSGKPALTKEGTYAITADSIASWLAVLPGEYNVWVQLVNNDNTPLEPPVIGGGSIVVPIDAERFN
jgi:hypothetical protein